jgi:general secretion pathway protein G
VREKFTFWFVLALLGIGVFYAIRPRMRGSEESPEKAAYADIHGGIKSALDEFQVDNGFFPKTVQDLLQQPSGATNWHGPYVDPPVLPVDPWGRKYIYEFPGKHGTNGYDLFSAGPDGKAGTEDDIGSWMN